MLSFRPILVAAVALAAVASAIPAPPPPPTLNTRDVLGSLVGTVSGLSGSLDGVTVGLKRSPEDVVPAGLPTKRILGIDLSHILHGLGLGHGLDGVTSAGSPNKRGQPSSPGDIFKACSDGVELIVVKIGRFIVFPLFLVFISS